MSIRLGRRKQVINLINEQEERAKQRLFEISYFDDQKLEDESQILYPHTQRKRQSTIQSKIPNVSKTRAIREKNYLSLDQKTVEANMKQSQSIHKHKRGFNLDALETTSHIFNSLQSNQVFVGNKVNSARENPKEIITISQNKKRVETMPVIQQRSNFDRPIKNHPSIKKLEIITDCNKPKLYKPQHMKFTGYFSNRHGDRTNGLMLKMKLKRDLFNTIESKLAHYQETGF